ncbi:MAG TPA: substrate-binding domain-containing protein [Acidimicrobiia bacterium]|nr:substrate-binding domain-containing protein [Acidimicrobiia bacterium]
MNRGHRRAGAAAALLIALSMSLSTGIAHAQGSSDISISGSSTVEPITSLIAEFYAEENPAVAVRVDGPGTGDGFKLFCEGETDASDASRPIKDEEATACAENGVEYTEFPVAIDGLSLVANTASKLKCVDFPQIYGLFGPESDGTFATAQAIAAELGSTNKALPSKGSVKKFTPGPESGTYDSFIEIGYESILEQRVEEGKVETVVDDSGETVPKQVLNSDGQFPNDNDIVKRVEGSKDGIGFFGFAYYEENQVDLADVAIVSPETGKCVKATRKTIQKGTYPLRRDLFVYANNTEVGANKALKGFLDFYFTKANLTGSVADSGYVPQPSATIREAIATWKALKG